MKCLSIQLNLKNASKFNPESLIDHLRSIGRYPEIDRDPENSSELNLNFFTEDASALWQQLKDEVLNDRELGAAIKQIATIVCEGDQGWDNQILLWPEKEQSH